MPATCDERRCEAAVWYRDPFGRLAARRCKNPAAKSRQCWSRNWDGLLDARVCAAHWRKKVTPNVYPNAISNGALK